MPGKETRMSARSFVFVFPTELQIKRSREVGAAMKAGADLIGKNRIINRSVLVITYAFDSILGSLCTPEPHQS
jgi:hypothetical protein